MRRLALVAPLAVLVLAGCGAEGTVRPLPAEVQGTLPKPTQEPAAPAAKLQGDAAAGEKVWATAGCASCHTLKAAGSTGTIGPNLDDAKPDFKLVTTRVTFGKGVMPSFKGQLKDQQIADVAAYVVKSTGGSQ
jgi:mono/diheme cytochrome c family protein